MEPNGPEVVAPLKVGVPNGPRLVRSVTLPKLALPASAQVRYVTVPSVTPPIEAVAVAPTMGRKSVSVNSTVSTPWSIDEKLSVPISKYGADAVPAAGLVVPLVMLIIQLSPT